jgi:hypothetical protein
MESNLATVGTGFSNLFLFENTASEFITLNGVYLRCYEGACIIGNNFSDTVTNAGEHIVRIQYATDSVIAHNSLSNSQSTKVVLTIRGRADEGADSAVPNANTTRRIVVIDNDIVAGESGTPLAVSPQNDTENEEIYDVIVDGNKVTMGANSAIAIITRSVNNVSIRCNVIKDGGRTGTTSGISIGKRVVTRRPNNIWIANNTHDFRNVAGGATIATAVVYDETQCGVLHIRNELLYAPSAATVKVVETTLPAVVSNNVSDSDAKNTDPVWTDPDNDDYSLGHAAYKSAGASYPQRLPMPLYDFKRVAFSKTARSIGAVQTS